MISGMHADTSSDINSAISYYGTKSDMISQSKTGKWSYISLSLYSKIYFDMAFGIDSDMSFDMYFHKC